MTYHYRWTHATACLLAAGGVAYQTAIVWEMLADVSLVTRLGVPLATISAALLPVMAEAAWRAGQRGKALLLIVPVLVLLAFVLPSGVSRLGEAHGARITAAGLSAEARARAAGDLDKAERLVTQSLGWVASECATGKGAKCDGQMFTLAQRTAYRDKLRAELASTPPVATPWLPVWHPALLTIGLELAIVAMLFYGLGPVTLERPARIDTTRPRLAITERDFATDPITEEEIEEIKRHLGLEGINNRTLAQRLGCSEGQASKLVTAAVDAGMLCRARIGREVRITAH